MKETITAKIALHYIQARILKGLQDGLIDLKNDSLRNIAKKINEETDISPQKIKHHLEQLLKLGALNKIDGRYVFDDKRMVKTVVQPLIVEELIECAVEIVNFYFEGLIVEVEPQKVRKDLIERIQKLNE